MEVLQLTFKVDVRQSRGRVVEESDLVLLRAIEHKVGDDVVDSFTAHFLGSQGLEA